MAGFEIIVRPVVFPNIRPTPTRSLAPEDDPEKGLAVIKGASGRSIDLPFSWNLSSSKSKPQETKRRVDEVRIYQKEDDETVNRDNFIDVQVANKIWTVDPSVGSIVKNIDGDSVFVPNQGKKVTTPTNYARVKETDNIEIREKDKIIKNPDAKE